MTDATATARTARRLAQIAAVKKIVGGDANTMLIAAVFGDGPIIRDNLNTTLQQMIYKVECTSNEYLLEAVAAVMRDHPRTEPKRGKRKDA